METKTCRRYHHAMGIAKLIVQTATLVTGILVVHELDRIHHRIKRLGKEERRVI